MKHDEKKVLRVVTNEAKEAMAETDVVTPSMYASIFLHHAQAYDISLDQEEQFVSQFLDEKISLFETMQKETATGADQLSRSTQKALSAIQDKDKASLQEVARETRELKYQLQQLKKSLYTDELTRAYNRKWLRDTMLQGESNAFACSGALTMIDLNYFKAINDTYGHIIGDKLLVFTAKQLARTKARVVRYGGDEFMLLFPQDTSLADVTNILHTIRDEIAQKRLKAKGDIFRMSFSFGSVSFEKGEALEDVIEKSDAVMYEDKTAVKKRIKGIYF